MPTTPDRPDSSDDPLAVAEAAPVAARGTPPGDADPPDRPIDAVPAGRPTEAVAAGRPTEGMPAGRPTEGMPTGRPTEAVAAGRPTVQVDGGERPTVLVDEQVLAGRETVK